MKKEKFENANLEIIFFDVEDVVTTSGDQPYSHSGEDDTGGGNPFYDK